MSFTKLKNSATRHSFILGTSNFSCSHKYIITVIIIMSRKVVRLNEMNKSSISMIARLTLKCRKSSFYRYLYRINKYCWSWGWKVCFVTTGDCYTYCDYWICETGLFLNEGKGKCKVSRSFLYSSKSEISRLLFSCAF